jgi:hypothetical protein
VYDDNRPRTIYIVEREISTKNKNTRGVLAKLVIEEERSVGTPRYSRVLLYVFISKLDIKSRVYRDLCR